MTENPWDRVEQHPDDESAGTPWFFAETYLEFHRGLEALLQELEKHRQAVEKLGLTASPFEEEVDHLRSMVDWGTERLDATTDSRHGTIAVTGVSYGSLRYLKAGVLYRAFDVAKQRSVLLAKNRVVPRSVLRSFDTRIEQLRGMAEMGKLSGLKPADVLFELTEAQVPAGDLPPPPRLLQALPPSTVVSEVVVVDEVLRKRCLPLLRAIDEVGGNDQYDSVIREMSVVLEDRVREMSRHAGNASGAELLGITMARDPVLIRFSPEKHVQEAAHLFFRGYSGLVRNDVMHRVVESYTRERMVQLLGTVDYLLYLLSQAEVSPLGAP
ncbi:TIGR02391 family protein [Thioalkalivibrio thiocyanodenitrificans]|uniref:TIGR02391 family protein n=1 Tax=Thioalkalivibrio thiocyanodenitrificans TaxID=243063 RepID=UPI00037AC6B8|nr:TIGR02391 family protein [Thioalkalivibrio thiocyanodenitrificans]